MVLNNLNSRNLNINPILTTQALIPIQNIPKYTFKKLKRNIIIKENIIEEERIIKEESSPHT